jgi:hypothetical protein
MCYQRNLGIKFDCAWLQGDATKEEREMKGGASAIIASSTAAMIAIYQMI